MARRHENDQQPAVMWDYIRSYGIPVAGVAALALTAMLALHWTEQYLVRSPRFTFRLPQMAGDETDLRVTGVERAAASRVRAVFQDDHGKSVFLLPLAERRAQLRTIEWVRDAVVIRRWPHEVDVLVEEREPVAFARIQKGRNGSTRVALIDEDGTILPIPDRRRYELPVLMGVRDDQTPEERKSRVRLMQHFYKETAPLGLSIPEVDLARLVNLKCRVNVSGTSMVLWMGVENFEGNLRRYLTHREEILRRMPGVMMLDLRLPDRITAATDEKESE